MHKNKNQQVHLVEKIIKKKKTDNYTSPRRPIRKYFCIWYKCVIIKIRVRLSVGTRMHCFDRPVVREESGYGDRATGIAAVVNIAHQMTMTMMTTMIIIVVIIAADTKTRREESSLDRSSPSVIRANVYWYHHRSRRHRRRDIVA